MAIRPLTQSALAGIADESKRFERSAASLTRLASSAPSGEGGETVEISAGAREAGQNADSAPTSGLERAMVDMRVSKYAFIANLKVLQTSAEVEEAASKIVR